MGGLYPHFSRSCEREGLRQETTGTEVFRADGGKEPSKAASGLSPPREQLKQNKSGVSEALSVFCGLKQCIH